MKAKLGNWLQDYGNLLRFYVKFRRVFLRLFYCISHYYMIKRYMETHQVRKLQIGSGQNVLDDWLNTDLSPREQIAFLDATKKFPFNNETFDYVYSEHLIEHLEYKDAVRCLQECYHILKPKGKIRISTPDLQFLINLHCDNPSEVQKQYMNAVARAYPYIPNSIFCMRTFVITHFFRGCGHKLIYDFETLKQTLEDCGFVGILRCNVGQSKDPNLSGIESHGKRISSEFNKLESFVVEATKPVSEVYVTIRKTRAPA